MSLSIPHKCLGPLHKAFLASFPSEGDLRLWVQFSLNVNLNEIKKSTGLPEIVLDLFYWVEGGGGWALFLQAGIDDGVHPLLHEPCSHTLTAIAAGAGVADAGAAPAGPLSGPSGTVIWDETPFVDRYTFSIDLEELLSSPHKRVAVVNGPPKSGKSYCSELLSHLRSKRWPKASLAVIDLKDDQSPQLRCQELCRRLLYKLRLTKEVLPEPLPGQAAQRWAHDLANWLIGVISQLAGPVWIVLDGFGDPLVPDDTIAFIGELAAGARDQNHFRLVLLDYSRALSERADRATRRSEIDYVAATELQSFLNLLDQEYKASAKPGWDAAQAFVTEYAKHTPGSTTQIEALRDLFPDLVRPLVGRS